MAFTTRPELRGTFGAVASTHWLASATGMGVLERGGSAFDAAVAAGFVLQVVEPHLNGPGGEVPILGCRPGDAEPFVICGQGCAPAAATIDHFRALGLDIIPGTGQLAACVPGAFGAWLTLLRDWGTATLREVLSRRRLATQRKAIRWCRASRTPLPPCEHCSKPNGPVRRPSICPADVYPSLAGCSAIPGWPHSMPGCWPMPKRSGIARRRSAARSITGIADPWPRPSTGSAAWP